MILEALRPWLYPLGFIANALFGFRVFFQWFQSEKNKLSVVTRPFWIISLIANGIMTLHALIQVQYPICIIQTLNAVIAWRNLDLMRSSPRSTLRCMLFMGTALVLVTSLFILQSLFGGSFDWMRAPRLPWSDSPAAHIFWGWQAVGLIGIVLFGSRYWIQWWLSEKHRKSLVGKPFWWISLSGALLSLAYFIQIKDVVNILSFSLGVIPYIRNLVLLQRKDQLVYNPSLFLFAGEQSGDVLGEKLIQALKSKIPSLQMKGVGGPLMRSAGLQCTLPMEQFQVMGITDVAKALPRLFTDFRTIKADILKSQPKAVVFIDYPDFNMRMAKALRKNGYKGKLIHYVCPSVWAWRPRRIKSLAKTLDLLLAVLPFEPSCFKKTALSVAFVGHPLVTAIDSYAYTQNWQEKMLLDKRPILALFPGSRRHEIEQNLPIQWEVAKRLSNEKGYQIAISSARPELNDLIQKLTHENVPLVPNHFRYELMRDSSVALATSGTVTLELGLHATPTVITYRLAKLNYLVGRYLFRIRLPFYTLVNIICEQEVFPEFIHKDLSTEEIYQKFRKLIEKREECQNACSRLRSLLSQEDASEEAAKAIGALL